MNIVKCEERYKSGEITKKNTKIRYMNYILAYLNIVNIFRIVILIVLKLSKNI